MLIARSSVDLSSSDSNAGHPVSHTEQVSETSLSSSADIWVKATGNQNANVNITLG